MRGKLKEGGEGVSGDPSVDRGEARPVKSRGHSSGRVFSDRKFPASWLRLLTSVKNSKGYESRQTQITRGHSKQ